MPEARNDARLFHFRGRMRVISKEENGRVLNLVQALLGGITPAFRAVAVRSRMGLFEIFFVLDRDDAEARVEIDVILDHFDSMNTEGILVKHDVLISSEPLIELDLPDRWVFMRKE